MHVVALLEKELGRTAVKDMLPMQPGDVTETFADVGDLMRDVGFRPADIHRGWHSRFCRVVSRLTYKVLRHRWTDELFH